MQKLRRRQAIEISHNRFDSDVERLTHALSLIEEELLQREAAEVERNAREERDRQQAAEEARAEEARQKAEAARRAEEERRQKDVAEAERAAREEREKRETVAGVRAEEAWRSAAAKAAHEADEDRQSREAAEAERAAIGRHEHDESAQQVPNTRRVHEETVHDPEQVGFALAKVDFEARDAIGNTDGNRSSVGSSLPTPKGFKVQRLSALGVIAAATAIGAIVLFAVFRTARESIPNVTPVVGTSAIEPEAQVLEQSAFNRRLSGERFMDRRQQQIEDWEVEQARLNGHPEHLLTLEQAEKAAATDTAKAVTTDTPDNAPATTMNVPFGSALKSSDQVGNNAATPAAPIPPPRPKARPTQSSGGLY